MTSKEKTRAMKKHATVMAAEAVAEEKEGRQGFM